MGANYDFSGYATKFNVKCSDGRTITADAFKDQDGARVPLVFQHVHDRVSEVVGHGDLEYRPDGMYMYGSFNNTQAGQDAKEQVRHGDITHLSIYANQLKHSANKEVLHGLIREVSLVLAAANPGALIDFPVLAHSLEEVDDEAYIYNEDVTTIEIFHSEDESETNVEDAKIEDANENKDAATDGDESKEIEHAEKEEKPVAENEGKTVKDVFDEFTEEQKKVVYFMIGQAIQDANGTENKTDNKEGEEMKHNVFENEKEYAPVLSHDDIAGIFTNAKRCGSLRDAVEAFCSDKAEELAHSITDDDGNVIDYGIANMKYLFPDYKSLNTPPEFIKRKTEWVDTVMSGVHKTPFSRIKSMFADITMEDARAKGYIKGNRKEEEVFSVLKRVTGPTTIYKKQKLDRDDVVDITDFDVVAWIKGEMRMMLDEEIARAVLIGDGRSSASDDKINELNIRPIWKDDPLFTISRKLNFAANATEDQKAKEVIKQAVKARKDYRGSGNPVFFTTEDWLTNMLLLEDGIGHRLYKTEAELATAMRVSKIVTVPVMENQSRSVDGTTYDLIGIIVNLDDYNVGADKGGEVNMFDDFDIDYNAQKYLIETRCSGAMTKPYSAIVLEANFQ